MFCKNCGIQLAPNAKFCGKCGVKVEASHHQSHGPAQSPPHEPIGGQPHKHGMEQFDKTPTKKKWFILGGMVLFLAILTAGAILFFGQNQRNERMFQEAMNQGRHYLEAMDLTNAELAFLRAIEIDPRQVEPYLVLADIYVEQEDFERAFDILEQGTATVVDDIHREELEQKQDEIREIYEQQEDRVEHESVENDQPEDAPDEVEDIRMQDFVWILEPSIVADDINYLELRGPFGFTNDNKRHFQSPFAVIRRGTLLGLIDNSGNINGDVIYDDIFIVFHRGRHVPDSATYTLDGGKEVEVEHEDWVQVTTNFMLENDEIVPFSGEGGGVMLITYYYSAGLQWVCTGSSDHIYENEPIFSTPIPIKELVPPFDPEVYGAWGGWQWYPEQVGLYGVLYRGEILTDFIYTSMGSYSDGLLAVELDGYWGYINKYGGVVIPIEYDASWSLRSFIFDPIDYTVNEIFTPFAFAASEGFVPLVRDGLWEMRNVSGELVIPPGIFEQIRPVYAGRSWVKYDGLWGIIQVVPEEEIEQPEFPIEEQVLFPPDNWEEWFWITYAEWGDYIEYVDSPRGGVVYAFTDGEGWLNFGGDDIIHDSDGRRVNPEAFPIGIGLTMYQFMGIESTSVEELRRIYGAALSIEHLYNIDVWQAGLINADYRIFFGINDENDSDIRSVGISRIVD